MRGGWPLAAILTIAALLRLAHWWAVRGDPFFALLAMDSQEYDRWALEIAAGAWVGEGVFFQAPLYPYLLAVVYRLLGRSLDAVYLLQIAAAVAGCWALYRAGRAMVAGAERGRAAGDPAAERAGLAAAALAALYGPFLFYDVQLLKESLAVTVTCFLLWMLLAARRAVAGDDRAAGGRTGLLSGGMLSGAGRCWLVAGALLGVLALLRENALLVAPALLLLAWRRPSAAAPGWWRSRRPLRHAGLLAAGFLLALAPLALRNQAVAGSLLPTTFQGGVNFYIGNNPDADGRYQPIVPGRQVPFFERNEPIRLAEADLGRPLAAGEVSRYWLGKSLDWARREPAAFAALQVRKLGLFWSWYEEPDAVDYYHVRGTSPALALPLLEFGAVCLLALAGLALAWWRRRRPAGVVGERDRIDLAPPLLFTAAWMASTVIFFIFSRYRLPVVPALLLLAALPVARLAAAVAAVRARGDRESGDGPAAGAHGRQRLAALALALLIAASWAAPHLAGFEPLPELVHYNLGRIYDEAGEPERAVAEYRRALAADSDQLLPLLNLGAHAARAGRYREAQDYFERAAAAEPRSDDAWANLAAARFALGDLAGARRAFDQALGRNPKNPQAIHNRALLHLREGETAAAEALHERLRRVPGQEANAAALAARIEGARRGGDP